MSAIPLQDPKAFDEWLRDQWTKKDELLEYYLQNGNFPPDTTDSKSAGAAEQSPQYIETTVRLGHWIEVGQIFVVLATIGLLLNVVAQAYVMLRYGTAK